ncbi:tyrosine-type recombinase/integrase [Pectobacterium actinidiae]|uniref:tyrosine-type recombinase/integrase n=1 Tax=Pectobacterium actinidiae TaxID=1507808 RepID=UPI004040C013
MALSDLIIRQARATGKTYNLPDSDGLGLVVSPVGGKSWHLRYYWQGKQKRISLGGYPEIGLRKARDLRDEARALLAKGINPHIARNQKRRAARLAAEHSFSHVYQLWLDHRRRELREGRQSTLSQIQRNFARDVLPVLGERSIFDIRRPDLLDVIERIERRKAFTIAEKVRTWFNQLFRFALVKLDGLETNPAADLDVVAAPKPPVAHNPYLALHELPPLLCQLRRYQGDIQTQLGIRLLLLTGVRTGELRLATPEQFDLEQGLWNIPPENVKQLQNAMRKNGKRAQDIPLYVVPLSVQAIEIVRYLLEQVKPAQRYLLAHRSDLTKRISENTLNGALKRMGYGARLTGHGIRATISTALNELGYPKVWIEAQLSHTDPNKVSAAYNHAQYVEPRRRMMQDWADRLDLLEQGLADAASLPLTIRVDGVPVVSDEDTAVQNVQHENGQALRRLSPLPPVIVPEPAADEPEESAIQRERMAMLKIYESPHNLPVSLLDIGFVRRYH